MRASAVQVGDDCWGRVSAPLAIYSVYHWKLGGLFVFVFIGLLWLLCVGTADDLYDWLYADV